MKNKTSDMIYYVIYSMLTAAAYGLAAFFVIFRGLAGEVMLYAYIWNIASIIFLLTLDKVANDILLSKELVITNRKTYFIAAIIHTFSFISFRTTLYLFYSFVLIASRVYLLRPGIMSSDFRNFVLSIEYCLILVVAFDKFLEHLTKDEQRLRRISAKFDRFARFMAAKRRKKGNK